MARPRKRDYETLRRELIDAGGRLLAEAGPAALSTRRVAQETGTSTTAVYSLFGDKAGLVREMFLEGFDRLTAAFAAVPRTGDPLADLLALGDAYQANARANPHLYELMFGRPVPEFQPDAEVAERIRPTFDALVEACGRCIDAGVFADLGAYPIAVQLNAMAHGLCSLELRGALGDRAEADAHWRRAFDSLVKGLSV
ncbi:TetR/AcrR family transcriptional regulator [Glycomyces algeriensis]|uniref:TetR family transcriptional regulator n=1 Tax=Glycomyces algeriensis TaxID=256037 RepID=A0A9W6GD91_9ACTN|nr:TetR/AcrR family transcriptional regulator [Glycomyces algeriensis]MDA1368258.1 TetR/AcrR family transcriptional regulator [Glycomyces algeriensis]MDR7351898.1 AcrR family transcriptional regulator [Glycomyces algeriensis]GLI44628.1 TetR family transcriptional regulator [Glycomyces algeriensis]